MDDSPHLGAHASPDSAEAQVQARVAWYYYVGGMTQQEIADRLKLTRLRVNRIVGQVRADGLVRIEVRLPIASCVALEERLKARYGLDDAGVVPTVPNPAVQYQMIGEAAGVMLDPLLRPGIGLGVGWGKTLHAAARSLTPRNLPGAWVTSLMGGLTRGSGANTFEVATEFARMLGAECSYVPAPIHVPSAESRSTLLTHYGLADVMRRAREGDVALVAAGDLSGRSLLAATSLIVENLPTLEKAGAVGDVLGTFLDEYGRIIDHPLNERVMALPLDGLKAYPISILASGGEHKLPIVRAVLNARYVRRLVTDEAVAEALVR